MKLISFIIPCFNGGYVIEKCLSSILNLDIPDGYSIEVIVVDNNSIDKSKDIVLEKFPEVKLVTELKQGRSEARNRGVVESRGDLLAFIDVDVEVDCKWLDKILKSTSLTPRWGIATSIIRKAKMRESWFENFRVRSHQTVNSLSALNIFVPYVNSAAILVKKVAYVDVAGFDNCFNYFEDLDFGRMIALKNYTLISSDAEVSCYFGLDWKISYFTRCFKMGFMSFRYFYKWTDWSEDKCFVQALKYYGTSVLFVWRNFLRIDYTLFQTFCLFLNMLGVCTSRMTPINNIPRIKLSRNSWVKIYSLKKVQFVNIATGDVQIIKR